MRRKATSVRQASEGKGGVFTSRPPKRRRAAKAARRGIARRKPARYLIPAALRSSAALSVFSHENAVNFSPLASFTSCGVRPKWP